MTKARPTYSIRTPEHNSWLAAIPVMIVGALFSLFAFFYVNRMESQRLIAEFEETANEPISLINDRIQTNLAAVQSLVAFYQASEIVNRDEFNIFASSILAWHVGIQALEWLPGISSAERRDFERSARLGGLSDFKITERANDGSLTLARSRYEYFPVYFVEPLAGNKAALGFDVMSEPVRAAALSHARQCGEMVVSDPISLVQGSNGEAGVLVVAPVNNFARTRARAGDFSGPTEGFVLAVFRIETLVEGAVQSLSDSGEFSGISIYANSDDGGQTLVFDRQLASVNPNGGWLPTTGPHVSRIIHIAERDWQIIIRPPIGWPSLSQLWLPWFVLISGLTLTVFAGMIYRARQRGIARLAGLAESLEIKNKTLETYSSALSKYLPLQVRDSVLNRKGSRAIAAQRKRLTIFFADIQGFTGISNELSPDELTFILNDFFSEISAIGLRYGATLDKYVGDAVIMFFGDPTSGGVRKDAITCVRMAVEIQTRMIELREHWQSLGYLKPIHIRIAIHTGDCNVGNFGCEDRMSYTIVGLNVNIAARVEKLGRPDSVTVTDRTYELVKNHFKLTAYQQVQLEGVARDIRLYTVDPSAVRGYAPPDLELEFGT